MNFSQIPSSILLEITKHLNQEEIKNLHKLTKRFNFIISINEIFRDFIICGKCSSVFEAIDKNHLSCTKKLYGFKKNKTKHLIVKKGYPKLFKWFYEEIENDKQSLLEFATKEFSRYGKLECLQFSLKKVEKIQCYLENCLTNTIIYNQIDCFECFVYFYKNRLKVGYSEIAAAIESKNDYFLIRLIDMCYLDDFKYIKMILKNNKYEAFKLITKYDYPNQNIVDLILKKNSREFFYELFPTKTTKCKYIFKKGDQEGGFCNKNATKDYCQVHQRIRQNLFIIY